MIRQFFAAIETLYGSARYNAMWPTIDAKRAAMRMYGQDIVDLGGIGRSDAISHCRRMMGEPPAPGQPDWAFINMSMIVRKPAPMKAAHRDWRENLPPTHPDAPRAEAQITHEKPDILKNMGLSEKEIEEFLS